MKKGIKRRLVFSYFLMIFVTVLLFEFILVFSLRHYYLINIKEHLTNQGMIFSSFYEEFLSKNDLPFHAETLIEDFSFYVPAQVQIIDMNGRLYADSLGSSEMQMKNFSDVAEALHGRTGQYTGAMELTNEEIMAVSYPLVTKGEQTGIIRFVTSLEPYKKVFQKLVLYLTAIAALVIAAATVISYFLAGTITKPVKVITAAANEMASGNMNTRVKKLYDDELGNLADTINFMASEIQKLEKLKKEFIASVSHELRTPLTSIKGWGVTLQSMTVDNDIRKGLEIMVNESDRLNVLVNDLLDFSSLSSGKIKLSVEEFSLQSLIEQVYQQMYPRSIRQHITFTKHCRNNPIVKFDKNRIKQVLINVLDNAFKFTPQKGLISIVVYHQGKQIIIEVMDTGEGIEDKEISDIMNKFYKGKSKSSGSGLGLAICQEIIALHNGSLAIMSERGNGTVVTISLPL